MKKQHVLLLSVIALAILVAFAVLSPWRQKQPDASETAQFMPALQAYVRDLTNHGQPLPSTVSLSELEKKGYISPAALTTFRDTEVTWWFSFNRNDPQAVMMCAWLPDGTVTAILADGSTHHFSREEFAAQLQKTGQRVGAVSGSQPLGLNTNPVPPAADTPR